jgi:hypothetical protein
VPRAGSSLHAGESEHAGSRLGVGERAGQEPIDRPSADRDLGSDLTVRADHNGRRRAARTIRARHFAVGLDEDVFEGQRVRLGGVPFRVFVADDCQCDLVPKPLLPVRDTRQNCIAWRAARTGEIRTTGRPGSSRSPSAILVPSARGSEKSGAEVPCTSVWSVNSSRLRGSPWSRCMAHRRGSRRRSLIRTGRRRGPWRV